MVCSLTACGGSGEEQSKEIESDVSESVVSETKEETSEVTESEIVSDNDSIEDGSVDQTETPMFSETEPIISDDTAPGVNTETYVYSSAEEPSDEVIHVLVDCLQEWSVEAMMGEETIGVPIVLSNNQACELAACSYFWEYGGPWGMFELDEDAPIADSYILPEDELETVVRNLFGSSFSLDDFTNTIDNNLDVDPSGMGITSSFGADNTWLYCTLYKTNGNFEYAIGPTDFFKNIEDINIISVDKVSDDSNEFNVQIEYCCLWADEQFDIDSTITRDSRLVDFVLAPDNSSDYGWVIKEITFGNWTGEEQA